MSKKTNIQEKLSNSFELPREVLTEVPVIKVIGVNELFLENHKGIIEYAMNTIRINTLSGVLRIEGEGLQISEINQEDIKIIGNIQVIEFIK